MNYKCRFPNCGYKTSDRSQIDLHHIIPISLGGTDDKYNKILLCPNHHRRIYVPNIISGTHMVNASNKIELLGYLLSSSGVLLEYKIFDGDMCLYKIEGSKWDQK